jgi:hypothetical protein
MFSNALFHPHHVIPSVELIAAVMEFSHASEPHSFMETDAVFVEIFIFFGRTGDAGVKVQYVLKSQNVTTQSFLSAQLSSKVKVF